MKYGVELGMRGQVTEDQGTGVCGAATMIVQHLSTFPSARLIL